MAILTTAAVHLIVVLAIGIIVGLMFRRYGRGWLGRQTGGATGMADITYALVGIAGSFIAFHVAVILGILPTPLMLYLAAIAGAAIAVLFAHIPFGIQTRKAPRSLKVSPIEPPGPFCGVDMCGPDLEPSLKIG